MGVYAKLIQQEVKHQRGARKRAIDGRRKEKIGVQGRGYVSRRCDDVEEERIG